MKNRTNYTQHDKVRDKLWIHNERRKQLEMAGFDPAAASRLAFHEVREGNVKIAWRLPGNPKKYLNYRRAAQLANEQGVRLIRDIRFMLSEKLRKLEKRNRKKSQARS